MRILAPMREWKDYIQKVLRNCSIPKAESLHLDEDHPAVADALLEWRGRHESRIRFNHGKDDFDGMSWAACFKHHTAARMKLLATFGVSVPTVQKMRQYLIDQSNQQYPARNNWVELLPVREADTLGIHLSSYLFVQFVLARQYPFV